MKLNLATALLSILAFLPRAFAADPPAATNAPAANLPIVKVIASDPVALEGASSGAFTILRNGDLTAALTVHYALSGTASNGVDYVALPDALTLAPGVLSSNLVVQPIDNNRFDPDKKVVLTLVTNASYGLSFRHKAEVTIVDNAFNNIAPVVTLIQPTNGTVVAVSSNVTLQASATDADDPIATVSFFANDHLIGTVTNAPYSLVWSNVPPGKFQLEARATDQGGETSESDEVKITVTNVPPTVSLVSPKDGDKFAFGDKINLKAEATPGGGKLASVSFFANDRFVGRVSTAPYELAWSNAKPGDYSLRAVATDEFGTSAKSEPVHITVQAPTKPQDGSQPGKNQPGMNPLPNGGLELTFSVATDGNYQVEFSRNLRNWTVLGVVASVNGQVKFTDTSRHDEGRGFYRVVPAKPATP